MEMDSEDGTPSYLLISFRETHGKKEDIPLVVYNW